MDPIKVVFAFDENYVTQGLISALSLLDSSRERNEEDKYEIYFLMDGSFDLVLEDEFSRYLSSYENLIHFKFVASDAFYGEAYDSRHVTRSTFLRLKLPHLFDFDKVIYSDVDVLYLSGLGELWQMNLEENFLAAVVDVGFNRKAVFEGKRKELPYWDRYFSGRRGTYFQAGLMLMNLKKLREGRMVTRWREMSNERFEYQDMDMINITCYPLIKKISTKYSVIPGYFKRGRYEDGVAEGFLSAQEVEEARRTPVLIHYAGARKPWNCPSALGNHEYWCFLRKFPLLEKKLLEQYGWSWYDRIRKRFVSPLF